MSVNMGQAVGYLDLDTSKFKSGLKSALSDLKVFQSQSATAQDKISGLSSAATGAGRSLTKGLTVPLLGIGAASLAVTGKFDAGMSKVQAISGATAADMEKLRDKAKEMGAQTKFSATESAEAFSYMAMAGWKTGDMLDGIEGIMNLAAASGEDLATTSDIVTDALTAFGLSAKDSTHFADVLAAASSNANTNVSMMGETFKYVAPVAGALGFNVEDVSTAIGLMANAGIKGSQAGTALRNIFTRMVKPTKQSAAAMEKLGVQVKDSHGNMKDFDTIMGDLRKGFGKLTQAEKAQTAAALAGQYGMSGLLAIVNASDEDFDKLKGAIEGCDGASQEMAETMMDNLPGALTLMKSALEGLGIRIGEVITPAVTKIVQVFTKFISWLSQASDGTLRFAVAMGVILASIGPVLLITGALAGSVVNLINVYQALSKVLAGKTVAGFLKAAIAKKADAIATGIDTIAHYNYRAALSGMGTAVTSAISKVLALAAAHKVAALAALGVVGAVVGLALYMHKTGMSFDDLKKKVISMFDNFAKQAPEILNALADLVVSIAKRVPGLVKTLLSSLGNLIIEGLSGLKEALPQILNWWQNQMPQLIRVGSDMIVNLINGVATSLPELIDKVSDVIVVMIDSFSQNLPQMIEAGVNIILALIQGVVTALPQLVKAITNFLSTSLPTLINGVVQILNGLINALIANLPAIISAIVTMVTTVAQTIADNADLIINAAIEIIKALAIGLVKAAPEIMLAIAKINIALVKAFLSIVAAVARAGVKIAQALWRGISSWAGALVSKAKQLGKRIFKAIVAGLGRLISTGRSWIRGLWTGISSWIGNVVSKARSGAKKIPKAVKSALGSLYSAGADFIQGLWNGMKSKLDAAIDWVTSKVNKLPKAVKKVLGIGSPSWIMREYGEWFMEGLYLGLRDSFGQVLDTTKNQMAQILDVYNPLKDYDFGLDKSMDVQLVEALKGLSTVGGNNEAVGGNVITQNIAVDGADNPEDIAERLARQLKISMRTV